MRKVIPLLVLALAGYFAAEQWGGSDQLAGGDQSESTDRADARDADSVIADAFRDRRSDVQVRGRGEVARVLADDNQGSRHQRFILRLASGQTVLVAHNIDLAPRLAGLKAGDEVEFYGEYEWNDQGGVIHWTHRDPQGRHPHGWLKYRGETYQ